MIPATNAAAPDAMLASPCRKHGKRALRASDAESLTSYRGSGNRALGKTVEAGAVIRQTLIDVPGRRVVVAVPVALVPQWRDELLAKFGLQTGPDASVQSVSHEEATALQ